MERKKGTSVEILLPSDWPVGKSDGVFFMIGNCFGTAHPTVGGVNPGHVIMNGIRQQSV